MSLRGFARLGSSISVLDFAHLGSSLSVRGVLKVASTINVYEKLYFASNTNYIDGSDAGTLVVKVADTQSMSMTSTGGTLHGTWSADSVISLSDRRLKDNIRPLPKTLQQNYANQGDLGVAPLNVPGGGRDGPRATSWKSKADTGSAPAPALSWVLRQLRPVSYNFRQGNEAKHMRFGFIADEMERVLPQVVRELPGKRQSEEAKPQDATKGIVYPDLIAVLTSIVKDFNVQMNSMQSRMDLAEAELDRLDREDPIPMGMPPFFKP